MPGLLTVIRLVTKTHLVFMSLMRLSYEQISLLICNVLLDLIWSGTTSQVSHMVMNITDPDQTVWTGKLIQS